MPKLPTAPSLTYLQLLNLIRAEIAEGKKIISRVGAEKNWNIGKAIDEYVLNGKDRASYGDHVFDNLSGDLGIHSKTLRQSVDFYHKFPIWNARSKLSWTHFRDLLTVPDPEERKRLLTKAREENLTTRELKDEIKKKKIFVPTDGSISQLKVVRGQLYTYRVNEYIGGKTPMIRKEVDLGFEVFSGLVSSQQLGRFAKGDIVETFKNGKSFSVRASKRKATDLYTFKAKVLKLIDADTLDALMDLGFYMGKEHKLRLRGIDCPEIGTPEGHKAKGFVEDRLKQCKFIIVKTYKDDKYGRYLADVFYKIGEDDPAKVAAEGIFLNQELLDDRLAVKWRE